VPMISLRIAMDLSFPSERAGRAVAACPHGSERTIFASF